MTKSVRIKLNEETKPELRLTYKVSNTGKVEVIKTEQVR